MSLAFESTRFQGRIHANIFSYIFNPLMRTIFFIALLFSFHIGYSQSLDGTYKGNEPRLYKIDDFGNVVYYPPSLLPWYFEVTVKIRGDRLDVFKRYVYTDSMARKHYADSLTNTYQYAAKLVKVQSRYLARTYLINNPAGNIYINGKYSGQPNAYNPNVLRNTKEEQNLHQWYRYSDGKYYTYKESIEQALVIKPDIDGIWINNKFYKKEKL
jgi:hypothetical protein